MDYQYLCGLNAAQKEAVLHEGKPLLILAGAGSGKTRVITTKIAYFIGEKNIAPWSILAVTFTNKAAKEMASRAALIEPRASDSMLRTFHSFGAWFLRRNAEAARLNPNFVIYDDDDSVALLQTLTRYENKNQARAAARKIAIAKDMNLNPDSPELTLIDHTQEFRDTYASYEKRLGEIGNVDFGDLIKKPIDVLRDNPDIKTRTQQRFRVIMVDEYQDANVAQALLLRELSSSDTYLCVVGDDDQSIYRFRGAEVRNILEFPQMVGGADIIKLEENYRSTSHILDLANSVVCNNSGRHGKKLVAARGEGLMPRLAFLPDAESEADSAANLILRSHKKGGKFSEWAILYRTNAQSLNFENAFVRLRIPYRIVGSLKFYEREEIKDALALLSFLVNPKDEISFRRIINKPPRGIGGVTIEKILEWRFNENDWDIEAALRKMLTNKSGALAAKAARGTGEFLSALDKCRAVLSGGIGSAIGAALDTDDEAAPTAAATGGKKKKSIVKGVEGLARSVAVLIKESGIAEYHLDNDEISGDSRVANLQELVNSATIYEASSAGLIDFLEHIELDRSLSEDDDSDDRVTLITLHNTKGLEFRRVIMTGMEQGLFPRAEKKDEDLEEERRLFYVGVTRAMDELHLTSCATRVYHGQFNHMKPSIFLHEADKKSLEISGDAPYGFKRANANRENYNYNNQYNNQMPRLSKKTSSDGKWSMGDRVFNEDYGYGEVCAIKEEEEAGPVISVQFETGSQIKFLSLAQSKKYMKIKD